MCALIQCFNAFFCVTSFRQFFPLFFQVDLPKKDGAGPSLVVPDTPQSQRPDSQKKDAGTHIHTDTHTGANGHDISDIVSDLEDKSVNFPIFTDNVFYSQLSPGERITLAYKYANIPKPVFKVSEKQDSHEVAQGEKDRLITSFPVAPVVNKAFSEYVSYFEKASFKALPADTNSDQIPASNKFDFKPGFQTSPVVDKWELKITDKAIPQVVSFDGNVESIQADKKSGTPKNIRLTDGEWGNLQKAASFSLRGLSHASWFRECALGALDEALPLLNPNLANDAVCIGKLQDLKQFLRGLDYTIDILAKLSVYTHAGVTSTLRHDFLVQEGKSILQEERLKLFTLPYGTPLVFQGQVHTVAPQIKEFRSEVTSSQLLDTAMRTADSVSKASTTSKSSPSSIPQKGGGGGGGGGGNKGKQSHNQKFPKSSNSNVGRQPFPPSKGDSRSRGSSGGGQNRSNRGRGKRGN